MRNSTGILSMMKGPFTAAQELKNHSKTIAAVPEVSRRLICSEQNSDIPHDLPTLLKTELLLNRCWVISSSLITLCAAADGADLKFDFGSSPIQPGFLQVTPRSEISGGFRIYATRPFANRFLSQNATTGA